MITAVLNVILSFTGSQMKFPQNWPHAVKFPWASDKTSRSILDDLEFVQELITNAGKYAVAVI